ncbi:hypothetical protein DPMN_168693 [Dreissena polymorpha]|uniref:Uncharacterized protein n=1 Tax=Dreissena polymorpha TaxID=45954 RepID=A0A9D4IW57_DREPO|nr:hypothetical protein DPMN_168693 [Dreissena polymorpha]
MPSCPDSSLGSCLAKAEGIGAIVGAFISGGLIALIIVYVGKRNGLCCFNIASPTKISDGLINPGNEPNFANGAERATRTNFPPVSEDMYFDIQQISRGSSNDNHSQSPTHYDCLDFDQRNEHDNRDIGQHDQTRIKTIEDDNDERDEHDNRHLRQQDQTRSKTIDDDNGGR